MMSDVKCDCHHATGSRCCWVTRDVMPSSVESSPVRHRADTATTTTDTSTSTAAAAAPGPAYREKNPTPIPLIYDSLTFDARQEKWIKDLERKVSVSLTFFVSDIKLGLSFKVGFFFFSLGLRANLHCLC